MSVTHPEVVSQALTTFGWARGVDALEKILGKPRPDHARDIDGSSAGRVYAALFANWLEQVAGQPTSATAFRWLHDGNTYPEEGHQRAAWETLEAWYKQFSPECKKLKEALGHKGNRKGVREGLEEFSANVAAAREGEGSGNPVWLQVMTSFAANHNAFAEQRLGAQHAFRVVAGDGWDGAALGTLEEAVGRERTGEGKLRSASVKCQREQEKDGRASDGSLTELIAAVEEYSDAIDAVIGGVAEAADEAWEWAVKDAARKIRKLMDGYGGDLSRTPMPPEVAKQIENIAAACEIGAAVGLQVKVILGAISPLTFGISGGVAGLIGIGQSVAEKLGKRHAAAGMAKDPQTVLALVGWDVHEKEQEGLERGELVETAVLHPLHSGGDVAMLTVKGVGDGLEDGANELIREGGEEALRHGEHVLEHAEHLSHVAEGMELGLGPLGQILNSAGYAMRVAKDPAQLRQVATPERIEALKGALQRLTTLHEGLSWTHNEVTIVDIGDGHARIRLGDLPGTLYADGRFVPDSHEAGFEAACESAVAKGHQLVQPTLVAVDGQNRYQAKAWVHYASPNGWSEFSSQYEVSVTVTVEGNVTYQEAAPYPLSAVPNRRRYNQTSIDYDSQVDLRAFAEVGGWLDGLGRATDPAHPFWNFCRVAEHDLEGAKVYTLEKLGGAEPEHFTEWFTLAYRHVEEATRSL